MDAPFVLVALPVTGAAFLIACMGLLQRHALKGKSSPVLYLAYSYGWITLGFALIYVLCWGLTVPQSLQPGFWRAVLVGTLANYGIQYLHAKALTYTQGEVSLVVPLSAMTPGFITIAALTLGEVPGIMGIMGIALMSAGSWVLLFKSRPKRWWEYLTPLWRLSLIVQYSTLDAKDKERAVVVWLSLGSALLGTAGLLCDGLYTRRGGDLQGMWVAVTTLWALLGVGFYIQYLLNRTPAVVQEWSGERKKFLLTTTGYAALIIGATALQTPVFFDTFVAYVGTLGRLRILFGVVLAFLIFKEQDIKRRLVVALIVVAGAILIASEDLPVRLVHQMELFGF